MTGVQTCALPILRQQLTSLREAQGIFLVIEGKRLTLMAQGDENDLTTEPGAVPIPEELSSTVKTLPHLTTVPASLHPSTNNSEHAEQAGEKSVAPFPMIEEKGSNTAPLQEMRPMARRPTSTDQPMPAHENAKSTLRRELAGSFLLAPEL